MQADVHTALDLIAKIDARGGAPRPKRAEYERLKRVVMASSVGHTPGNDLGGTDELDELGLWPMVVAQLAAIAAVGYIGWHVAEPVIDAAKIAGPVVTYGGAAWLLWFLFRDDITGRPRKGYSTRRTYGKGGRRESIEHTVGKFSAGGGGGGRGRSGVSVFDDDIDDFT